MLTFGDINDYRAEHTIIALNDVHFTSQSLICAPNGDPIAEQYTFFAREINRNLGSNSIKINPIKLDIGNDNVSLSRYEDVEKLGEILTGMGSLNNYKIRSLSKFSTTWQTFEDYNASSYVTHRQSLPFIDQLITSVETLINDPTSAFNPLPLEGTQYVFEITFNDIEGNAYFSLTLVMAQAVPNTYTYRVISPTRTNFSTFSTISRDDLWTSSAPPAKVNDEMMSTGSKQPQKKAQQVSSTKSEITGIPKEFLLNTTDSKDNDPKETISTNSDYSYTLDTLANTDKREQGAYEYGYSDQAGFLYNPPKDAYQDESGSAWKVYAGESDKNSGERYLKAQGIWISKTRSINGFQKIMLLYITSHNHQQEPVLLGVSNGL
jgi:hypothetical protein